MLSLILLTVLPAVAATPSVWSCPLVPMSPFQQGLDFRMGEDCPAGSFVHYYSCCDDNPFQCCFHFETWAIIVFALICIFIIAGILFFSGRLLLQQREV